MKSFQCVLFVCISFLAVAVYADKVLNCYNYKQDAEVVKVIDDCKAAHSNDSKELVFLCELESLKIIDKDFKINIERGLDLVNRLAVPEKKEAINKACEVCKVHKDDGHKFIHCMHTELDGECIHKRLTPEDPED